MLLAGADRDDEPRVGADGGGDLVRPHLLDPARGPRRCGRIGHPDESARGERCRPRAARALVAPAAAAAALLAASGWLAEPGVGYLAACLLATAVGVAGDVRARAPALRLPLAVACARSSCSAASPRRGSAAARALRRRTGGGRRRAGRRPARAPEGARRRRAGHAAPGAARASSVEAAPSRRRRPGSSASSATRPGAVYCVRPWRHAGGVGGNAARRSARARPASPGSSRLRSGSRCTRRRTAAAFAAVAASLLYTSPPADRLTRGLSQRMPGSEVTEGFVFAPPDAIPRDQTLCDTSTRDATAVHRARSPAVGRGGALADARARAGAGRCRAAHRAPWRSSSRRRATKRECSIRSARCSSCSDASPSCRSASSRRARACSTRRCTSFRAGRAFTANAAALGAHVRDAAAGGAARRPPRARPGSPRVAGAAIAIVGALLGPYFVRTLSRGIAPPAEGAGAALWADLGGAALPRRHDACWCSQRGAGASRWAAGEASTRWVAPVARAARGDRRAARVDGARASGRSGTRHCGRSRSAPWSLLGRAGAGCCRPPRWPRSARRRWCGGAPSRGRVELAERDVRGLSAAGRVRRERWPAASPPICRRDTLPRTPQALLERYVLLRPRVVRLSGRARELDKAVCSSPASARHRSRWRGTRSARRAAIAERGTLTETHVPRERLRRAGRRRARCGAASRDDPHRAAHAADRQRCLRALVRTHARRGATSRRTRCRSCGDPLEPRESIRWRRIGTELHGDWPVQGPDGPARAHVEVDLRGLDSLIPRGGLLLLLDLAAVGLVWLLAATADGRVGRWLQDATPARAQLSHATLLRALPLLPRAGGGVRRVELAAALSGRAGNRGACS